jgi:catechol 2,3-dioxygenase-like lactoylglutathione lyase family enzyme
MVEPPLVTHLLFARLRVPDPEEAATFYERVLGLVRVGSDDSSVRLSVAPRDAVVVSSGDIVLERGAEPGLSGLGFAVSTTTELAAAAGAVAERTDGAPPGAGTVSFLDPDGCEVEIRVPDAPVRRPPVVPSFTFTKLGHVTRRSPDPGRQARWWQETLGFRVSDQIEDSFFFLRCNRDHHALAFVEGASPGAHHVGLELETWDDLRLVVDRLVEHGAPIEFGPGRHGPGKNIFVYVVDPWGIRWELFCELERIDDDRATGHWQGGRRETVNLWGPRPPETYFE